MGRAMRLVAAVRVPVLTAMLALGMLWVPGCGNASAPAPAEKGATPSPSPTPTSPVAPADAGDGSAAEPLVIAIDADLPVYQPVEGVSGVLRAAGSDTMLNLVTSWAGAFAAAHPSVQPQVEGKGSSTAPTALLENQAQFGPMSREMEPSEIDLFEQKFGFPPAELRVAIDCVAVFVHRDNPLKAISLSDVRRVFSVEAGDLTWGDLGVTDPAWAARPISVYGRNSASGTYKYFKDAALGGSDFKPSVKEQPGSAGVVAAVANDQYGIGYSGIGYASSGVVALAVAYEPGDTPEMPDVASAASGMYPLARFLYVYMKHEPGAKLDALGEAFVRFLFSREGQEIVAKDGEYPVTAAIARDELGKLGLEPGF